MDARLEAGHDGWGIAGSAFHHSNVMAGLDPAIHTSAMSGWVYIMTNKPNGTLYIGVTSDLARRVYQHRESLVPGFTEKYGLTRLVYAERHEDIRTAIQRETSRKRWRRAWKLELIVAANPGWKDLHETIN